MFRSTPFLLSLLFLLVLALTHSTNAVPPRRAAQLQHFQGSRPKAYANYNKDWKPVEPEPSSSSYSSGSDDNGDDGTARNENAHVKCPTTKKLVGCRDTCYTTYGPYSNFYGDCLDCCRKVCEATAYCPVQVNYWKKPATESYGIRKLWGGK